jgi:hypothetical protein
MPKKPHTELNCSPDGPWITLHAGHRHLTFNLRYLIRELMPAQHADRRRTMAHWLQAREAEQRGEPALPPPKANARKPIPASRRIPPRTAKGKGG